MITVEEITKSATSALSKTTKVEKSYEEKVNDYLDTVLEVQASFSDISLDLNNITNNIHEYFNEKEEKKYEKDFLEIRSLMMSLVGYGNRVYASYRNSNAYSSIKTALTNYKGELNSLRESIEWLDRRYSIHANNPEFEILSKKISDINKRLSSRNQ